jgi:hypothetical protein
MKISHPHHQFPKHFMGDSFQDPLQSRAVLAITENMTVPDYDEFEITESSQDTKEPEFI